MNINVMQNAAIVEGRLVARHEDGTLLVAPLNEPHRAIRCARLASGAADRELPEGSTVLVWLADQSRGVVLGEVTTQPPAVREVPEELVLEAKENLTLKCGDGSITIRADGKVLIKGKNLVSLALETNRIKGGSVSIN